MSVRRCMLVMDVGPDSAEDHEDDVAAHFVPCKQNQFEDSRLHGYKHNTTQVGCLTTPFCANQRRPPVMRFRSACLITPWPCWCALAERN